MSVNVYDLANELERGIRQLPEYQAVVEAKKIIKGDDQAKELWDEFMAFQTKIQGLMQSGQLPTEEDQKVMEELGKRMEANPQVKHYFDNQQRLSVYIADIEKIVFSPLRDLI